MNIFHALFSPFGCDGAEALSAGGGLWAGGDGLDGGTVEMRWACTIANGDEPVLALGGDADICRHPARRRRGCRPCGPMLKNVEILQPAPAPTALLTCKQARLSSFQPNQRPGGVPVNIWGEGAPRPRHPELWRGLWRTQAGWRGSVSGARSFRCGLDPSPALGMTVRVARHGGAWCAG
jgi:hypothetical protein